MIVIDFKILRQLLYKECLLFKISKQIYGHLFAVDIGDKDIPVSNSESKNMCICFTSVTQRYDYCRKLQ